VGRVRSARELPINLRSLASEVRSVGSERGAVRAMSVHARVERGFAAWARAVCQAPVLTIALMLALTAYLVSWVPEMRFDNSTQGFLHRTDSARVAYENFRLQFGQDEFVLIAVRPPNIFDPAFLERLRAFHDALEAEVPHLEDVTSMLNARSTRGERDRLIVEDLFEEWPEDAAALARTRERALADPLYRNLLFSRNYAYTTVNVRSVVFSERVEIDPFSGFDDDGGFEEPDPAHLEPLSDAEINEFLGAVYRICDRFEAPDFELHVVGSAVINQSLSRALEADVIMFVLGALLVMAVILYVLFRSWVAVVLPLAVVLLSLFSAFGVMVMIDIPASVTLQLVPILLLAVGVCDAVHLLALVDRDVLRGKDHRSAIIDAISHAGLAVFMTSVTTAAGFLSFVSAQLAPVSHLGIIAPVGIMLAFLYTVTLLPALLVLVGPRAGRHGQQTVIAPRLGGVLAGVGAAAARHPWRVMGCTVILSLLSISGIFHLRVSQNAVRWFPSDDQARSGQELLDREFGGTTTLELILDTGRAGGLYEPEVLDRIDRATEFALRYELNGISAGKALSILDVLKATHQALNENRPESYTIPRDRELIAQELLLFENAGTDDLEELVDTQYRVARLSLRVPIADAILYQDYVDGLRKEVELILGPEVSVETTGIMRLLTRTMAGVVYSLIKSYITALLVITPLMVLLIGALGQGMLAMIPNLLPVLLTLGLMGWMDIPIDMSSMLVGGIIIGLAVDDTIHFMHRFRGAYAETREVESAIHRSLESAGAAILCTTLILGAGFVVMEFAYMRNASQFGQLACFATVAAFAADVLVAPALLVIVGRRRAPAAGVPSMDVAPDRV